MEADVRLFVDMDGVVLREEHERSLQVFHLYSEDEIGKWLAGQDDNGRARGKNIFKGGFPNCFKLIRWDLKTKRFFVPLKTEREIHGFSYPPTVSFENFPIGEIEAWVYYQTKGKLETGQDFDLGEGSSEKSQNFISGSLEWQSDKDQYILHVLVPDLCTLNRIVDGVISGKIKPQTVWL